MNPDRKITDEIIECEMTDIYHFTNSPYKPDWHTGDSFIIDRDKKLIYMKGGYNSGFYPITDMLERLKDEDKIIPTQDYLIEIKVRLTKCDPIEKIKELDEEK